LRLIYFALLLGGAININQNNVGIFVLVELPTVLYLSCATYFVINWVFLTRAVRKISADNIRFDILKVFIGFIVTIVAVFIIFLVAFGVVRSEPKEICAGKIVEIDQTATRILSIIYRVYMAILCVGLASTFLIYGTNVLKQMQHMKRHLEKSSVEEAVTERLELLRIKMTVLAATSTVSLLLEAVFMITIAILPDYNNNILSMVIILIAEVAPGIAIIAIIDVNQFSEHDGEMTKSSKLRSRSSVSRPRTGSTTGGSQTTTQNGQNSVASRIGLDQGSRIGLDMASRIGDSTMPGSYQSNYSTYQSSYNSASYDSRPDDGGSRVNPGDEQGVPIEAGEDNGGGMGGLTPREGVTD